MARLLLLIAAQLMSARDLETLRRYMRRASTKD